MSDRLDVVVIDEAGLAIHHQRWGATALYALLIGGPGRAVAQARAFDRTDEVTDVLAGCVIDLVRRKLVVAGPAEVIGGPPAYHLLRELSVAWPGWSLAYEPDYVVEPVVLYVRGLGLPLASLNEPHVLPAALGEPPFVAPEYSLEPADAVPARGAIDVGPAHPPGTRLDALDLSVRADNALRNAGFETVGDLAGLDDVALAARGIEERVRREIREVLAPE